MFYGKILYIYSKHYERIWGISLTLCDYLGINRKKITDIIKTTWQNRYIDTRTIPEDIKKYVGDNVMNILPIMANLDIQN